SGAVELVMEPDSLLGDWTLDINGHGGFTAEAFGPTDAHIHGSLGLDITGLLQPGENTVTVHLTTDRLDGGLRNPLYLAGDFGVNLQEPTLVQRPEIGRFEEHNANALPYYAGAILYRGNLRLDAPPSGGQVLATLTLPPTCEDACELSLNGGPW